MGRNIFSVCHKCEVQLMHFRGKEGDFMQRFQNDHADHEGMTEILSDYKFEPPNDYKDVFDDYHTELNDLAPTDPPSDPDVLQSAKKPAQGPTGGKP